jgi:hypothetical protein
MALRRKPQRRYATVEQTTGTVCWPRRLHHGEVFPVVYDPARPQRAFVHGWALFANLVAWLFVLRIDLGGR